MQVALPEAGIEPYVIGALTARLLLAFALPPLLARKRLSSGKDMSQQRISDKLPYRSVCSERSFLCTGIVRIWCYLGACQLRCRDCFVPSVVPMSFCDPVVLPNESG